MLSLDKNGDAVGIAFRLSDSGLEKELLLVWIREMITGLYQPCWLQVVLDSETSRCHCICQRQTSLTVHQ